ncbi:MAG: molybdopterin-dependent oxidoreductase [Pseudomonadales bacterium]
MQPTRVEKLSVCPLDCPDTCSLKVSVEGDRIVKVRGSTANPYTLGSVCSKVAKYYPDFVHGEKRIQTPLLRTGPKGSGQYREISWEEALQHIAENTQAAIARHGAETVLPLNYAGPHGKLAGGGLDQAFFARMGASDLHRSPLCGGVKGLAYKSLFGAAQGMPPEQAEHADLIIMWGTNTSVTNLHLMRVINRARKQGAKLVVIDPHETQIARQADLFLQVAPGSDVVLALKAIAQLQQRGRIDVARRERVTGFDEYLAHAASFCEHDIARHCAVSEEAFEQFVNLLSEATCIAMSAGVGLERTCNGGSAIRAAYAIPVLCGTLGALGQGIMASYSGAFIKGPQPVIAATGERRVFNILDSAKVMLDRQQPAPISVVFVYNHNPVATHPDQNAMRQALAQDDIFVVGCDVQMNDSIAYADIVLPACTHFEHHDIYASYGHAYLQRAEPVIAPVGQAKPNTEIFRLLAQAFGYSDSCFVEDDAHLMDRQFDLTAQGVKGSELPTEQALAMQREDRIWLSEAQLTTASGKIELYSQALGEREDCALPQYTQLRSEHPFRLLSPASSRRTNATFGGSSETRAEAVEIHPQDAARYSLHSGQSVVLSNALGEVQLIAEVTEAVAPGVLCVEKGAWCNASETGQSINALIDSNSRTDIGAGAAYYDTFVDLRAG